MQKHESFSTSAPTDPGQTAQPHYEILDHGVNHPDYFQGCGTSFTPFEYCQTGIGDNAKEAYEDAVEIIYSSHVGSAVDKLHLPKRPKGIKKTSRVLARHSEDAYYYVSVRYNLSHQGEE